jgi:hypothetical protein
MASNILRHQIFSEEGGYKLATFRDALAANRFLDSIKRDYPLAVLKVIEDDKE